MQVVICDLVMLTTLLLHPPTEIQIKLFLILFFLWLLPLVLSSRSVVHPSRSEFSQFICLSSVMVFFQTSVFLFGFPLLSLFPVLASWLQ